MAILDEITRYPVRDWIVWLGAGISLAPPTSLPGGPWLTWFSIEETCGPAVRQRIETLWAELNALAATTAGATPLGPIPRLETILGEIAVAEASTNVPGLAFMRGFRSFARVPFNENHALAAALLAAGATVVTPNFDLGIQAAYAAMGAGPLHEERVGSTIRYVPGGSGPGELWHVHGAAHDTASLGATIAMVKEGLAPEFAAELRRRLRNGAAIVFFGYSASDAFDVTPFFAQLPPDEVRRSFAAFVQHAPYPVPATAFRMLRRFRVRRFRKTDTTTVLRALAARAGCIAPARKAAAFDWKAEFRREASLDGLADVRDFLVCRLANVLGVNVNLLDTGALPGAERRVGLFGPTEFHKTMAVVYRPTADARKEREHDEAVKQDDTDMLGYFYAHGMLAEARRVAASIPELLAQVPPDGALDWRAYTSMSVHVRGAVNRRLQPLAGAPGGRARAHLADLVEVARRLGERPYRGVRFLNQIATAKRASFVLEALLDGREATDVVEDVLRLYGDASSVGGYVSTYRDLAIARFFLVRFHGQRGMLKPALAAIHRSLRLARAAGDRVGVRRAAMLRARIAAFVV